MKSYAAEMDGVRTFLSCDSDIDELIAEGNDIYEINEDGNVANVVYKHGQGWLVDRPTDDELCGLRKFEVSGSIPIDDLMRIIQLSLEDPDAAYSAIADVYNER